MLGASRCTMPCRTVGVAGAVMLLRVLFLPFRYHPLNDPDLGLRLPFGVDPTSLNHFSSFPSGHAMLLFALCVPLWMRSCWLGAAAAVWTLLAICLPLLHLGDHWASDIEPWCTGSRINLCALGHRGFQGRDVTQTNVRHGIVATWLFESTTIKKA